MISDFSRKVIRIISSIPPGRVCTYGIIALYADNSSGARQVARILHSSSKKYNLPWHRVVNRDGKISLPQGGGYEKQFTLLKKEGVKLSKLGAVDLDVYLWWPGKDESSEQPGKKDI